MTDKTPGADIVPKPFFVSIGIFLAGSYWVLEAFFDSILIADASFVMRLLPADANELWMRSLVSLLFVGFGLYAHSAHVRIRTARKLTVDAGWLLENAIASTIRGRYAICACCMNIRDEDGQWVAPDRFISGHTEASFLRVFCGKCMPDRRSVNREADAATQSCGAPRK